jgi:hypothetical protein
VLRPLGRQFAELVVGGVVGFIVIVLPLVSKFPPTHDPRFTSRCGDDGACVERAAGGLLQFPPGPQTTCHRAQRECPVPQAPLQWSRSDRGPASYTRIAFASKVLSNAPPKVENRV